MRGRRLVLQTMRFLLSGPATGHEVLGNRILDQVRRLRPFKSRAPLMSHLLFDAHTNLEHATCR